MPRTPAQKNARPDRGTARKARRPSGPTGPAAEYEIEALSGLEGVAHEELSAVPGARDIRGGRFWFPGDPGRLTRLKGSVAVYRVKTFDVPRPKALLGHQQLGDLAAFLRPVIALRRPPELPVVGGGPRVGDHAAAGRGTRNLAGHSLHPEEGELLIRLRPTENPNRIPEPPDPGRRSGAHWERPSGSVRPAGVSAARRGALDLHRPKRPSGKRKKSWSRRPRRNPAMKPAGTCWPA